MLILKVMMNDIYMYMKLQLKQRAGKRVEGLEIPGPFFNKCNKRGIQQISIVSIIR
jgi:hypothetical protein